MSDRLQRLLSGLASLRLTVVLLALSMALVFVGTWAQKDLGIWTVLSSYFRCWIAHVDCFPVPFLLPGGYALGTAFLANLVAAHSLRFQLTWKKLGIHLIHLGLILLLLGELGTALFAIESNLRVSEGQTVGFTYDVREAELVVIDPSDPEEDLVVALPEALLRREEAINHALLPFEVVVDRYYRNAQLVRRETVDQTKEPILADRGVGLQAVIQAATENAGIGGSDVDEDAAYVTFRKNGNTLGRYLVSVRLDGPQRVDVNGRPYLVELRFRRYMKPYEVTLLDFSHDRYTGTSVPRNFSSEIRLVDRERDVDRKSLIYMNNPLRYQGETFYQSSYVGDSTTVLQVVRNPVWTLPYIAVTMGALGMLFHFGLILWRFLKKAARPSGEKVSRKALWISIALAGLYMGSLPWRQSSDPSPFDLKAFGQIPVSADGRVKPFDTVARDSLKTLSGRESWQTETGRRPAVAWLLQIMAKQEEAAQLKVIRVDHPQVLALVGRRQTSGKTLLSMEELLKYRTEIYRQAQRISNVKSHARDLVQRKILELAGKMDHYERISPGGYVSLHMIPPLGTAPDWQTLHNTGPTGGHGSEPRGPAEQKAAQSFLEILQAYRASDAQRFNRAVALHKLVLKEGAESETRKAQVEVAFRAADPFTHTIVLYILAFLLCSASWLFWRQPLGQAAFGITLVVLLAHTVGLVIRVYLMDRPPVTNLYSSAVFVGWGCCLLALLLEGLFKNGMGTITATAMGATSLVLAQGLAAGGDDTMAVLQAVLDTNFWLATHVVVITIGYATTYLATFLGAVYVLRGVFTHSLDRASARGLSQMLYGVLCFSVLFSFVGTILGGIWADQSWGRFWGWDPKENGALLIVIWNALILHARWGGMIRGRGLAVLSILGGVVTTWSWFGTNLLGVGLHAYGFMEQGLFWLLLVISFLFLLATLGVLPEEHWRSDLGKKKPELGSTEPTGGA